MSETGPQENPLIPNKKLREMFVAMAEMRILDEHIAGQRRGKARRRLNSVEGQEACRVSTAIDLGAGDLISDAHVGVAMELLAGAKLSSLLARLEEPASGTKKQGLVSSGGDGVAGQLPWIEDVGDRLRMAMGAALAFKTLQQANIVVAYVLHGEASNGLWRQVLSLASTLELPIIFVVLPEGNDTKRRGNGADTVSAKARWCGVPGIPVDASDAVALYRVAQESIGRTRGGGGPVLVECRAYRLENARKTSVMDPLVQMKSFLLGRKVCSEVWLERAGESFRKRIDRLAKG